MGQNCRLQITVQQIQVISFPTTFIIPRNRLFLCLSLVNVPHKIRNQQICNLTKKHSFTGDPYQLTEEAISQLPCLNSIQRHFYSHSQTEVVQAMKLWNQDKLTLFFFSITDKKKKQQHYLLLSVPLGRYLFLPLNTTMPVSQQGFSLYSPS